MCRKNELTEDSEIKSDVPHRNRFRRLVDYATRLRNEKFVSLIDVMKDGSQWVNFYGVTCFHNCNSLETAAEEMQYKADKAVFSRNDTDPRFPLHSFPGLRMKARVLSSFFDCVRHTLKSLELSKHQYVAAVHTDTDNLHVHVAVNRVHPETGYINWLSRSREKLSRACRELELKHGFAPDNGCFVHAPGNRIVRKTALVRERRNALATREKSRRSGNILRRCRLPGYVKSLHRTGYLYINGWPAMVCISRCRKGNWW